MSNLLSGVRPETQRTTPPYPVNCKEIRRSEMKFGFTDCEMVEKTITYQTNAESVRFPDKIRFSDEIRGAEAFCVALPKCLERPT